MEFRASLESNKCIANPALHHFVGIPKELITKLFRVGAREVLFLNIFSLNFFLPESTLNISNEKSLKESFYFKFAYLKKIAKVPRGTQGEKSNKDTASLGNLVSRIGS